MSSFTPSTVKDKPEKDYYNLLLESRRPMGVSPKTLVFNKDKLFGFTYQVDTLKAKKADISRYLNAISPD